MTPCGDKIAAIANFLLGSIAVRRSDARVRGADAPAGPTGLPRRTPSWARPLHPAPAMSWPAHVGVRWVLVGISLLMLVRLWQRDRPSERLTGVGYAAWGTCRERPVVASSGMAQSCPHPLADWEPEKSLPLTGMRALLAGRLLDLQTVTAAELAQLPDIGEVSAQALVTARAAGHLRCQADLAAIRGLGRNRVRRLLAFARPLPQVCPSEHPTQ